MIDGKEQGYDGKPLQMTRKVLINSIITIKRDNPEQAPPDVTSLAYYIPGKPVLLMEGNQVNGKTAVAVTNTKKGTIIVIKLHTGDNVLIDSIQVEIID